MVLCQLFFCQVQPQRLSAPVKRTRSRRHTQKDRRGRTVPHKLQRSQRPGARDTEQRNPRSAGLDQRTAIEIARAISREDASVAKAVAHELPQIARAIEAVTLALANGGRLFYVGAGTSGRLATVDAAECAPTFGISPSSVEAVIAGGRRALTKAVEGVEDSASAGRRDLAAKRITPRDVVVGLSASGATPYVLGAMQFARSRRAVTIAITANPRSPLKRLAEIAIVPETGPEILAGSTRMKAGTAQKMVLNMLSTGAMVRLGHVYNNWMVDVALTNDKLRKRGLRILTEATGATMRGTSRALTQAGGNLRVALVMLKTASTPHEARRRLQQGQR